MSLFDKEYVSSCELNCFMSVHVIKSEERLMLMCSRLIRTFNSNRFHFGEDTNLVQGTKMDRSCPRLKK